MTAQDVLNRAAEALFVIGALPFTNREAFISGLLSASNNALGGSPDLLRASAMLFAQRLTAISSPEGVNCSDVLRALRGEGEFAS